MARPREFDEHQALGSAMAVFRDKGYEASSLMDLLKAMGLSKSSLYNSFGTKHDLFVAAIDYYTANFVKSYEDSLSSASSIKQGITSTFGLVLDMSVAKEDRRGCFLCACASEVLPHDEIAEAHIVNGLNRLENAFTEFVKRGQSRGEIPSGKDAKKLGEFLLMSMMGIQAMGRLTADRARMESILQDVEQAIM